MMMTGVKYLTIADAFLCVTGSGMIKSKTSNMEFAMRTKIQKTKEKIKIAISALKRYKAMS